MKGYVNVGAGPVEQTVGKLALRSDRTERLLVRWRVVPGTSGRLSDWPTSWPCCRILCGPRQAVATDQRLDATDPTKTAGDWPVALTVVMVMGSVLYPKPRAAGPLPGAGGSPPIADADLHPRGGAWVQK